MRGLKPPSSTPATKTRRWGPRPPSELSFPPACKAVPFQNSGLVRGSLEILLRPLVDALQRLFEILERIGHAEAQVAFAEMAECRAGKRRHAGLLQQSVGQRLGFPSRPGDVREHVECRSEEDT